MNNNLNFLFGMYEPATDSIIANIDENTILVIRCNDKLYLTEKAVTSVTELWNDWSFSCKDFSAPKTKTFDWDFLYIPKKFDNM